jgi:hypothetical protein
MPLVQTGGGASEYANSPQQPAVGSSSLDAVKAWSQTSWLGGIELLTADSLVTNTRGVSEYVEIFLDAASDSSSGDNRLPTSLRYTDDCGAPNGYPSGDSVRTRPLRKGIIRSNPL